MKPATSAKRYLVRGRVQGVGFRHFVNHSASALGVRGYVRNLDDGNVEVYAVGLPAQLDDLAGLLSKGPRFAEIRGVEVLEAAVEKCSGFEIRG